MADKVQIRPLSEDSLNRFRITHPDRDLRPLLRRLHRLSYAASAPSSTDEAETSTAESDERAREVDMIRLELIKWKLGVERLMASVENLKRQKEMYLRRAHDTVARTKTLKVTLEDEKVKLARKQRERDWMIKCDEVARKISAKGKSRADLDEQIFGLQQSLEEHRLSHGLYLETVQKRIDIFAQISSLVDDARNTKLPMELQVGLPELQTPEPESAMDVDEGLPPLSRTKEDKESGGKLNVTALPFQPAHSASLPTSRAASPTPATSSTPPISSSSRHALPSRPSRQSSSPHTATSALSGTTATHVSAAARLPNRPSTLRSVTTPVGTGGLSLEEGELGGEEEGEVSEQRGGKRSATESTRESGRSTRRK